MNREISSFSDNLTSLRKSKGMTRMEMAKKLGMPYTTYRNYEEGREPKMAIIHKIADALDVPVGDLLTHVKVDQNEKETLAKILRSPTENNLLKHYQKLNTQGKRKVVDYAEDMTKIPEYQDQPEDQKESLPDVQEGNDDTTE